MEVQQQLKQQLKAQLAVVGYIYTEIKVSSAIAAALKLKPPEDESLRMRALMDAGDRIRQNSDEGSGVASLIVTALRAERGADNVDDSSTAFVIDSLKNPKEIEVLANKIARSRRQPLGDEHYRESEELIELDQKRC